MCRYSFIYSSIIVRNMALYGSMYACFICYILLLLLYYMEVWSKYPLFIWIIDHTQLLYFIDVLQLFWSVHIHIDNNNIYNFIGPTTHEHIAFSKERKSDSDRVVYVVRTMTIVLICILFMCNVYTISMILLYPVENITSVSWTVWMNEMMIFERKVPWRGW